MFCENCLHSHLNNEEGEECAVHGTLFRRAAFVNLWQPHTFINRINRLKNNA